MRNDHDYHYAINNSNGNLQTEGIFYYIMRCKYNKNKNSHCTCALKLYLLFIILQCSTFCIEWQKPMMLEQAQGRHTMRIVNKFCYRFLTQITISTIYSAYIITDINFSYYFQSSKELWVNEICKF